MTLYNELKDAGIPLDSHSSDLYFKRSPEAMAILAKYPLEKENARGFRSAIDGSSWVDVPFAFIPWWTAKLNRSTSTSSFA